jgi:hypothetical protein
MPLSIWWLPILLLGLVAADVTLVGFDTLPTVFLNATSTAAMETREHTLSFVVRGSGDFPETFDVPLDDYLLRITVRPPRVRGKAWPEGVAYADVSLTATTACMAGSAQTQLSQYDAHLAQQDAIGGNRRRLMDSSGRGGGGGDVIGPTDFVNLDENHSAYDGVFSSAATVQSAAIAINALVQGRLAQTRLNAGVLSDFVNQLNATTTSQWQQRLDENARLVDFAAKLQRAEATTAVVLNSTAQLMAGDVREWTEAYTQQANITANLIVELSTVVMEADADAQVVASIIGQQRNISDLMLARIEDMYARQNALVLTQHALADAIVSLISRRQQLEMLTQLHFAAINGTRARGFEPFLKSDGVAPTVYPADTFLLVDTLVICVKAPITATDATLNAAVHGHPELVIDRRLSCETLVYECTPTFLARAPQLVFRPEEIPGTLRADRCRMRRTSSAECALRAQNPFDLRTDYAQLLLPLFGWLGGAGCTNTDDVTVPSQPYETLGNLTQVNAHLEQTCLRAQAAAGDSALLINVERAGLRWFAHTANCQVDTRAMAFQSTSGAGLGVAFLFYTATFFALTGAAPLSHSTNEALTGAFSDDIYVGAEAFQRPPGVANHTSTEQCIRAAFAAVRKTSAVDVHRWEPSGEQVEATAEVRSLAGVLLHTLPVFELSRLAGEDTSRVLPKSGALLFGDLLSFTPFGPASSAGTVLDVNLHEYTTAAHASTRADGPAYLFFPGKSASADGSCPSCTRDEWDRTTLGSLRPDRATAAAGLSRVTVSNDAGRLRCDTFANGNGPCALLDHYALSVLDPAVQGYDAVLEGVTIDLVPDVWAVGVSVRAPLTLADGVELTVRPANALADACPSSVRVVDTAYERAIVRLTNGRPLALHGLRVVVQPLTGDTRCPAQQYTLDVDALREVTIVVPPCAFDTMTVDVRSADGAIQCVHYGWALVRPPLVAQLEATVLTSDATVSSLDNAVYAMTLGATRILSDSVAHLSALSVELADTFAAQNAAAVGSVDFEGMRARYRAAYGVLLGKFANETAADNADAAALLLQVEADIQRIEASADTIKGASGFLTVLYQLQGDIAADQAQVALLVAKFAVDMQTALDLLDRLEATRNFYASAVGTGVDFSRLNQVFFRMFLNIPCSIWDTQPEADVSCPFYPVLPCGEWIGASFILVGLLGWLLVLVIVWLIVRFACVRCSHSAHLVLLGDMPEAAPVKGEHEAAPLLTSSRVKETYTRVVDDDGDGDSDDGDAHAHGHGHGHNHEEAPHHEEAHHKKEEDAYEADVSITEMGNLLRDGYGEEAFLALYGHYQHVHGSAPDHTAEHGTAPPHLPSSVEMAEMAQHVAGSDGMASMVGAIASHVVSIAAAAHGTGARGGNVEQQEDEGEMSRMIPHVHIRSDDGARIVSWTAAGKDDV